MDQTLVVGVVQTPPPGRGPLVRGLESARAEETGGHDRLYLPAHLVQVFRNRLKTPLHQVAMVMTALAEGLDISAACRVFGYHHSTISGWLERAGQHSAQLQERVFFQAVRTGHIQLDELVTKVKHNAQKLWVWTAITAKSKLIVALYIGGTAIEDACLLFHQLQLALAPGCLPVFTTDGLNQYFHGMTTHFGYWDRPPHTRKYHWFPNPSLLYAQLRKSRYGRKVTFLYSIIRLGTREVIRGVLQALDLSGLVQTSYVERSNLTLRELIAPLPWLGAQILLTPVPEEGWVVSAALRPFRQQSIPKPLSSPSPTAFPNYPPQPAALPHIH